MSLQICVIVRPGWGWE